MRRAYLISEDYRLPLVAHGQENPVPRIELRGLEISLP